MKNIVKILFFGVLASVFYNNHSFAQYDVKVEIKNSKSDTLFLGYYYTDQTYALDTSIAKNGKFSFKSNRTTDNEGMYFVTDKKGNLLDFLLMQDRKVQLVINNDNWIKNIKVKKNKDQTIYFNYMAKSDSLTKAFRELQDKKQTVEKSVYDSQLRELQSKNDSLKTDFIRQYPNHLLSKILLCAKPVQFPEFEDVYLPDGSIDSLAMRNKILYWYKHHYFDNVDLSCGGLLRTPKDVFYRNYNYFWDNVMQYESSDSIIRIADYYISQINDNKMFEYFVFDLAKRYLQDGIMGHDKIYVFLVEKYFKSGRLTNMSPSDIEMNIQRADKWRNTLIGRTVPDLACPEIDTLSVWHHLDELKNKYKVLVFWSVDCGHCTVEMPKLADFYHNNKEKFDFEIFSVHTEGNIKQMLDFTSQHNMDWINTNGLFANYDWREYFDIEKTPVIYILDKNNKILVKNIPVDNMEKIFEVLENGGLNL